MFEARLPKPAHVTSLSEMWSLRRLQMVRAHPLALQSAQLQHLIAEASAAQQGTEDVSSATQVQTFRSILASPQTAVLQQMIP